jgi:hypothetical protein
VITPQEIISKSSKSERSKVSSRHNGAWWKGPVDRAVMRTQNLREL